MLAGLMASCAGTVDPAVSGPSPAEPADEVSLVADAARYRRGSVVTLTVTNDGARTVYAEDARTGCSLVMLWAGDVALDDCAAERAPQVVAVEPGERRTVRIDLDGTTVGGYRAVFSYRFVEQPHGDVSAWAETTFVVE